MVQLNPSSTSDTMGAIAPVYSLSWLDSGPKTYSACYGSDPPAFVLYENELGCSDQQHQEKRESSAHLVVMKGTTHMLASYALHEHDLFVCLHNLYDLWCATRNLLLAARPAKPQRTKRGTSHCAPMYT